MTGVWLHRATFQDINCSQSSLLLASACEIKSQALLQNKQNKTNKTKQKKKKKRKSSPPARVCITPSGGQPARSPGCHSPNAGTGVGPGWQLPCLRRCRLDEEFGELGEGICHRTAPPLNTPCFYCSGWPNFQGFARLNVPSRD